MEQKRRYRYDPVEDTEEYKAILPEVHQYLMDIMRKTGPHGWGYCYIYWANKKRILWEKYRIKWKSPADLNPKRRFD